MHRTDAPDFETDIGNGERGFQETNPGNETILAAAFANAVQEELCGAIERAGIPVNPSSAADTGSLWGQLAEALTRYASYENVLLQGADTSGAFSSALAINNALALNRSIFLPPGEYKIDANLVIPAGAVIQGCKNTTLMIYGASNRISSNNSFFLRDLNVRTADGLAPIGVEIKPSTDSIYALENVNIRGFATNLKAYNQDTVNNLGDVYIYNCRIEGLTASSKAVSLNEGPVSAKGCRYIRILNSYIFGFNSSSYNIVINNTSVASGGDITISNCRISSGIFYATNNSMGFRGSNNNIDIHEFRFQNTDGGWFRDNIVGGTLSNTVTNNFSATSSRWFWVNNRDANGKASSSESYVGIYTKRNRSTSMTVGAGANSDINFDSEIYRKMARNPSYTKDSVYSNPNFSGKGYGNGKVFIKIGLSINNYPNTTVNGIYATITTSGGDQAALGLSYFMPGLGVINQTFLNFNGSLYLSDGETFKVNVANALGTSISIVDATIEVEGL